MRTDTEMLEFMLQKERHVGKDASGAWIVMQEIDKGMYQWCGTKFAQSPREAIECAMDAAESAELDEAWKWFRGQPDLVVRLDIAYPAHAKQWVVAESDALSEHGSKPTRDAAVLAAYRASKSTP